MIDDIIRGDTRDINVTVQDSDGVAFDVSGYTILMTVRKEDGTVLFTKAGTIVDAPTGQIQVSLTTETDVDNDSYYYGITITDGSNTFTVSHGVLKIINYYRD